jgi:flagellar assembly protein FliH
MSSSKDAPRQVPPPPNSKAAGSHTRFIPREELADFASWQPGALGQAADQGVPARDLRQQIDAARQAGYQDGYRDGLVALDSFKQSFARQSSVQFGELLANFGAEIDSLEQSIAAGVARVATELARQVVRAEIACRPELIAALAQQAVGAVLMSARHIRVHLHPDDHAWVAQGAGNALAARGAQLVADGDIERGGCRVESDTGAVDACIASRWQQAARSLGIDLPWSAPGAAAP